MRGRILKNIGWLFGDRVLRSIGSLAVGVLVARYLGPERYGLLNYALAFVFFFSFLSGLGLQQIVVRELKRSPDSLNQLLGTAFLMKLIGAVLALLLLWLALRLFEPAGGEHQALFLVIGAGFIFQSMDVIDYHFQAQVLSRYVVVAKNIGFIVSSLLKVLFVLLSLEVIWFALAGTIDVALGALFMVLAYRRCGGNLRAWRPQWRMMGSLLKYSWPLMLSTLLIAIHTRVDQVMIAGFMDTREVGLYSVAVRLSEFWYFVPSLIVSSVFPYFVELRERDPLVYQARLMQLYSMMFWCAVGLSLLVWVFGEVLIVMLFGEPYRLAYQPLVINIWAGIFVAQGVARGIWMLAENLQKYRLFNNLFAVSLNVAGNLVLIPRMGITGAAISTLITQGLALWVFSVVWKPLRGSTLDLVRAINPVYLRARTRP